MKRTLFISFLILAAFSSLTFGTLFPEQKSAHSYRTLSFSGTDEFICAAALQGLVARAVNEGRIDELLAIKPQSSRENEWIQRTEKRTGMQYNGTVSLTEAATQYRQLIQGAVLYHPDQSEGNFYQMRDRIDTSVNTATVIAGLLNALPVSEELMPAFEQLGFHQISDARNIDIGNLLKENHRDLHQRALCSLDPKTGNLRDLAVAHRLAVSFGSEQMETAMRHLTAPFLIFGWGEGDEFTHVAPASRYGGIETVSNWARNLSFLSAGSAEYQPRKIRGFDPKKIDWNDTRQTVSFMLSDGDNIGWMLNNFWDPPYYGSEKNGTFPFGFSTSLARMTQTAPAVADRLAETQPENISLIEFCGGYFYPDLFAKEKRNRENILRTYAVELNRQMRKNGTRILCFIVQNSDSSEAQDAYQIFAEEIESLTGMLVMNYAPYHGGSGKIYWPENRNGIEIPAVTARFCMWDSMNRMNAGGPKEIAEFITRDSEPNSWVAVHAWSKFGKEERQATEAAADCVDRLNQDVHVVTPEEMIWRIRMDHNSEETLKLLKRSR